MFGSTSKPGLGLTISTTAAGSTSTFGAPTTQSSTNSLFANQGAGATSQPAATQGAPFGSTISQPTQSGGLFGASSSQPAPSSGLFGSSTASQPAQSGGLFGAATSQPAQTSSLFGATPASQQTLSGGPFGAATSSHSAQNSGLFAASTAPQQSISLFGAPASTQSSQAGGLFGTVSSQPAHGSGTLGSSTSQAGAAGALFGTAQPKPATGTGNFGSSAQPSQGGVLFGSTPNQAGPGVGLFGGQNQNHTGKPAASLNLGQQPTLGNSTSGTRIDLEHLRPTTKFDQLTEELQKEILSLDNAILGEITRCNEVSDLLPAVAAAGSNIPNDVAYVAEKLEEVEIGLENDAEAVQNLKEHVVKKDANEARVCFREMDRLKMPSQYQASISNPTTSLSSEIYGGHGLAGWWNHPQKPQRAIRGGAVGSGPRMLQLPGDEDETKIAGPANLVDFFDRRTEEMRRVLADNKSLLSQVEDFVANVEAKIAIKERETMGRGDGRRGEMQSDNDRELLRYVFGEFERSLYEVAGKVGAARDGVHELVLGASSRVGLR